MITFFTVREEGAASVWRRLGFASGVVEEEDDVTLEKFREVLKFFTLQDTTTDHGSENKCRPKRQKKLRRDCEMCAREHVSLFLPLYLSDQTPADTRVSLTWPFR